MSRPNLPIEISNDPLPATFAAVLRYALAMFGTWLVSSGYLPAENVEGVLALITTAVVVAYGIWKTYKNRQALIVTTEAAPNSVGKVTK